MFSVHFFQPSLVGIAVSPFSLDRTKDMLVYLLPFSIDSLLLVIACVVGVYRISVLAPLYLLNLIFVFYGFRDSLRLILFHPFACRYRDVLQDRSYIVVCDIF